MSSSRPSTMDTLAYARRLASSLDRPAARLLLAGGRPVVRVRKREFRELRPCHHSLSLQQIGTLIWRIDGHSNPLWIVAFGDVSTDLVKGLLEPRRQGWQSEKFGEMSHPVLG